MKIFALIFNEEKHYTISDQGQIISFYLIVPDFHHEGVSSLAQTIPNFCESHC